LVSNESPNGGADIPYIRPTNLGNLINDASQISNQNKNKNTAQITGSSGVNEQEPMFSFSDGMKKKKLNSLSYAVFTTIRDKFIKGEQKTRENHVDSDEQMNEFEMSMTGQEITTIVLDQLNNDNAIKIP